MELDVARSIGLGALGQQVLPRPLADQHDGVSTVEDPASKVFQEPVGSLQVEGVLRDQAEVHITLGQRGVGGDEAGLTAHDLHQTDTVD